MNCSICGERMEGDGHTVVVHCPRVDVSDITPDCNPVHCESDEEVEMAEEALATYRQQGDL